jgi:hypothetical protein
MRKLKYNEVKIIREQMAHDQNNKCALCEHDLDVPCLDHHHKSGIVRRVLCRSCNVLEGKITNSLPRCKMTEEKLTNFLKNYMDYVNLESEYIHPTFKSSEEKKIAAKKRAKNKKKKIE